MKRILSICFVMLLAVGMAYSVDTQQAPVSTIGKTTGATMDVSITVKGADLNSFAFGFSSTDGTNELGLATATSVPAAKDTCGLSFDPDSSTASGSAYIYYKIRYDKEVQITVGLDGPLHNGVKNVDVDLMATLTPTAVCNQKGNATVGLTKKSLKNEDSATFNIGVSGYDNGMAYGSCFVEFETGIIPYYNEELEYASGMKMTIASVG